MRVGDEVDRLWPVVGHPGGHGSSGKPRAFQDQFTKLPDGNPLGRVALEDAAEDVDHLVRQGQDRLEKKGILQISTETGVLNGCTLPRVAATGQVDEDDAQAPDVVGSGCVAGHWTGIRLLTFWGFDIMLDG